MKIGILALLANPYATPEFIRDLGQAAEQRGVHSLWVAEHVVLFDDYDSKYPYNAEGRLRGRPDTGPLEPFAALAFLAAATTQLRLGTGICLVPQRNPVYTAKHVATVDWLSNGRVDFGIGVGWLAEEFGALGVPFARRGARCRAYVEVMKRLWCDEVSAYEGEFYSLPPCRQYPKPVQRPHPPIHVGGESDAALKRVAAFGQGWFGFNVMPDAVAERLGVLDRLLADRGRARREVTISVSPPVKTSVELDLVRRFRDAGADQVVGVLRAYDRDQVHATLDVLANDVIAKL
jgi:probable F420-dependent oxidoreductase